MKNWIYLTLALISTQVRASFLVEGEGVVTRVIDGDTYEVSSTTLGVEQRLISVAPMKAMRYIRGNQFRIRLASIDTEESNHPDKSRNTAKGLVTKQLVTKMLYQKPVYFRCYDFGYYGRAICNVKLIHQGKLFDLGEILIRNGLSPYVRKYGDNPFMHREYMSLSKGVK